MPREPPSNFYVEINKLRRFDDDDDNIFTADTGEIFYLHEAHNFYIRKKREADETDVNTLSAQAKNLFTRPGGSRDKEWQASTAPNAIKRSYGKDGPAVKLYRGEEAARLTRISRPHNPLSVAREVERPR